MGLISSLLGGGKAADPNKAARAAQDAQMKRLDAIELPELEEYILQNPELVGLLNEQQLGDSALEEISLDPKAREAQLSALQSLQEYSDTGVTDTDKYAMEQMLGEVAGATKSNQATIEADMARKGMDSSGAALMSKMNAQQSGANDARQRAMQLASQGQQNRMNALGQLASQSGQMQQQQYERDARAKAANDAIHQANAANKFQTQAANLSAKQAIENQRANIANQQVQVGNQLKQQNLNNELSKAGAQGNVANAMGSIPGAPQGPSAMQTLGTIGGGIAGAYFGGPAGAAAGASAGGAMGSMFEDGGVARNYQDGGIIAKEKEMKQHEKFKSRYMKKVQDELMGDGIKNIPKFGNGGEVVSDEMKGLRSAQGDYDTFLKEEKELSELRSGQDEHDKFLKEEKKKKFNKSIGALNSILSETKTKTPAKSLNLGSNSVSMPENIMNPVGPQEFANPYASLRGYADGGVPMYASDGEGDIIDSGMGSYAGDRVDAKVNDGEAVLNIPQQQRFMDLVRGKISVDELGDDDIIEGVPRDYRDSLHEKIEDESEGNKKLKGLEKLLEMLGEE